MKNKILLLFTNHRVAEKLWPIIPELSKEYIIDLFRVGLFSSKTPWVGDKDEREIYLTRYSKYLNNIIDGPGIQYHGDRIIKDLRNYIYLDSYSLVIYDDNREKPEYSIPGLYYDCKRRNIPVIGNSHGNEDVPHDATGISYDYKIDFDSGGIPANDTLKNIKKTNKHILVICNFLGNRFSPFSINFDQHFINESRLQEMSSYYNLPIIVKIKTRLDNPDYTESIKYVKQLIDCEVVANTDNIDQLIADSAFVISAPSTLAFKPIQLGIPTILIKGSGATGKFKNYPGLVNLNQNNIIESLDNQLNQGKCIDFIKKTIKGGESFSSTKHYVNYLKTLL